MRKFRFSEMQIVSILKEHDAGTTFVELRRRRGVHPNTVAAWKARYGGMESCELARSRAIEEESTRMRRIIANLSLENEAIKELISKKLLGPSQRKDAVRALQELRLSQRTACRIATCPRSVEYRPRRTDERELMEQIKTLTTKRRRFGYRRIPLMLRRERAFACRRC